MRPMLSRPLWQWQRKSRIASVHHRVPQTPQAKSRSTRDVQLKAIRVDAVKSHRCRACSPASFIIIITVHHPFPQQYLFVLVYFHALLFWLRAISCASKKKTKAFGTTALDDENVFFAQNESSSSVHFFPSLTLCSYAQHVTTTHTKNNWEEEEKEIKC